MQYWQWDLVQVERPYPHSGTILHCFLLSRHRLSILWTVASNQAVTSANCTIVSFDCMFISCRLVLLLALSSSTAVGATVVGDVLALLGGLQLVQLGSLSLLVYVATVWLEDGLLATLKNVLKQLVAGSFLFYVFRGQTTAHCFLSDVKYGGAKYAATGRGYKLQATPFMDLFQLYARCAGQIAHSLC